MIFRRFSAVLLLAFPVSASAFDYYINTAQGRIEQANGLPVALAGVNVPEMGIDSEGIGTFTVPGSVTFAPGDRVFFRGPRAAQIIVQGNLTIPEGVLIDASGGTDTITSDSQRNGGGGVGSNPGDLGGSSAGGAGQTGGVGGAGGQGGLLDQGTITPNPGLAGGSGSGGQTGEAGDSGLAYTGKDGIRHPDSAGLLATGGEGGAGGAGGFSFGIAAQGGAEGAPVSSGSNGVNGFIGFDGGDGANGQNGGGGRGGRYPTRDGTLRGGGAGSSGRGGGSGGGGGSGASGGGGGGGGSSGLYLFAGFFPKVDAGGAGGNGGNGGAGGRGGNGTRGGVGGAGAGAFELRATGLITLGGTLRANGEAGGLPSGLPVAGTAGSAGTAGTAGTARPDPAPKGGSGGNGAAGGRGGKGGNGGIGGGGGGGAGGTIILKSDLGLVKLPTATIETNGGAAGGLGAEAGQSGAYYESAPSGLLGLEQFDYPDGAIAGRSGGTFWNFKNTAPVGHSGAASNWDNIVSSPLVAAGRLVTSANGAVKREYRGANEAEGAVNDPASVPSSVAKKVYYRVTVTTGPTVTAADYFGISSMDFGTERIYFGKRAGSTTFGVEEVGVGGTNGSVTILPNTSYTLVAIVDFVNDFIRLHVIVNPEDLNGPQPDAGAAAATRAYTGTNWSTAVRFASGGAVTWDDLVVATTWDELGTVVTTATDEDNGSLNPAAGTGISLREAVRFSPSGSLITFAPSLSGQTITLTHPDRDMEIPNAVTIDATALSGGLTLNANGRSRHFFLDTGKSLTLRGLTLSGGNGAGGGSIAGVGGAIANEGGTLTLTQCTLSGNSAGGGGGAIFNDGTLTLAQCTLSGNSADKEGGAISGIGTLTLTQCTLSGNSAGGGGGAIFNDDTLTLAHCTLSGNSAGGNGGAIYGFGTLTLTHCTLSGNSAGGRGGAIFYDDSTLVLTNSIVAGNKAPTGPDIHIAGDSTISTTGVNLLGNTAGSDLNAGPTILVGDPKLTPLGYFGGPVQTMHPLIGSPAIDAAGTTNPGGTDARGFPRFVDGNDASPGAQLDIGAVEAGLALKVLASGDGGGATLRSTLAFINAASAQGLRVTFDPALFPAGTITLGGTELTAPAGKSVFIDASNLSAPVTISGNNQSRVFNIPATATVAMHSVRIVNGIAGSDASGGAILNAGCLSLFSSTLSENAATQNGGAISQSSAGRLALTNCTLANNNAAHSGGAICADGTQTLTNCTLSSNFAAHSGGAVYAHGTQTLTNCTLSRNTATTGGAAYINAGSLSLRQCTFSGNNSQQTAIFNSGALTLNNSIVAGNLSIGSVADIHNEGSIMRVGSNVIQSIESIGSDGGPAAINANPLLAPLGNYGGPTQTMPPRPGSPAIDAGVVTTAQTDQRGLPRSRDGDGNGTAKPDIGAVEASLVAVTNSGDSGTGSLRAALTEAAAQPGPDTIYFTAAVTTPVTLASEIVIADPAGVTIDATDRPTGIVIDGGAGTNRHFRIDPAGVITLQRLRLTGGNGGGGGSPVSYGGSIHNGGSLTVRECTLDGNTSGIAGAIYNQAGALTVERSTFHNNTAGGIGAILHESQTPMTITASTFNNNTGRFEGGAITVSNFRPATITHCTISGNRVTQTGGGGGGGIRTAAGAGNLLTLGNCIVSGNTDANSPGVPNVADGFLLSGNNIIGGNAKLAPLGDYGGPTLTMALGPGSPARGGATTSTATADQRGLPPVGIRDLGAYEAGNALLTNYNAWIWETLPNTAPVGEAEAGSDYDRDGSTNEIEWLAQTGPGDPASAFRPVVSVAGGNMVISFPTATGRTYRLEYNEILAADTWIPVVGSEIAGDGSLKSYSLTTSIGSRRFFRVMISPQ